MRPTYDELLQCLIHTRNASASLMRAVFEADKCLDGPVVETVLAHLDSSYNGFGLRANDVIRRALEGRE